MISRRIAMMTPFVAVAEFIVSRALAGTDDQDIETRLKALEERSGGRLGIAVLDTATGKLTGNRIDERFAMCSTFKALAVAFVLSRVDRGQERLDRRIYFTDHDLVAPYKGTKPHVGAAGMTIAELCEAAITVSDSTAANLLLASFGGPAALTAYLRSLGDQVTRVDGTEPNVNMVKPGDVHDTTTPRAMMETLQRLLLGEVLSTLSRGQLTTWMIDAKDAATQRLRLGLPKNWRIANKPGTWEGISTNDIGVIWPPNRAPIVVAVYLGEAPHSVKMQEGILADVARVIADKL